MKQALKALPRIEEKYHEAIMRDVMLSLSNIDFSISPPMMAKIIFELLRKHAGDIDFYAEIKRKSNRYILDMEDELRTLINKSSDPFETALRLAVGGNVIDFGANHNFSDELIHEEMDKVLSEVFFSFEIEKLKEEIKKADKILYLADNAGEIVFDKLFLELLPTEKITLAVRGRPIINDVLREDAEMVGITDLVPVVDNGAAVPGTALTECSEEFRKIFDKADLIIAKGQGNYETLSNVAHNIFFLLKVKCSVIARDVGCKAGDFIVSASQNIA